MNFSFSSSENPKQNDDGEKQSIGAHSTRLDVSRDLDLVFPETRCVSGTGRKAVSDGGPPEARLGWQRARSIAWAVAHVGAKRIRKRRMRRAEVGPILPGDCPRALRFG